MTSKGKPNAPELLADVEFNKKWESESQYTVLRKSNDPRFGEITLLKSKASNDMIFAKEKMVTSKQQASNDIRDLKSRIALNHNNLHRLLGYSTTIQKELCSTNYLSKAYYEFPKSDLQKEMNDRKQNNVQFTAEDLLNIGSQSVQGLNHLHTLNINHGDVRPLNIGYNRESRDVQILDRLNDPSPLEKLQVSNIINKKELFISPEVYKRLQGKDKTSNYNPYKNDLYSLGLSLLMAGNQESIQNVYKPNGDFNQDNLKSHLDKFDERYGQQSPSLCNLVHALLRPNESDRFTASELLDAQQSNPQQNQPIEVENNFAPPQQLEPMYSEPKGHHQVQNTPQQFENEQHQQNKEPQKSPKVVSQQQYSQPEQSHQQQYSQPQQFQQQQSQQQYTQPKYVPQANSFFEHDNHQYTPFQNQAQNVTYQSAPHQNQEEAHDSELFYHPPSEKNLYTFYDQGAPVRHYVNSTPVSNVQQPNVTYVQAPMVYHQPHGVYSAPPVEGQLASDANDHPGERLVTVHKIDGTSYSYYTKNPIDSEDTIHTYELNDPSKKGGNSETHIDSKSTHMVFANPDTYSFDNQSQPQYTNVTYIQQPTVTTIHKVNSVNPDSVGTLNQHEGQFVSSYPVTYQQSYGSNQPVYVPNYTFQSNPSTTDPTTIYQMAPSMGLNSHVVHSTPVNYIQPSYTNNPAYTYIVSDNHLNDTPVEVRRGSSNPHGQETTTIKKKYIVQGDKVIEVVDDSAE